MYLKTRKQRDSVGKKVSAHALHFFLCAFNHSDNVELSSLKLSKIIYLFIKRQTAYLYVILFINLKYYKSNSIQNIWGVQCNSKEKNVINKFQQ